jgi:hypothetical protein
LSAPKSPRHLNSDFIFQLGAKTTKMNKEHFIPMTVWGGITVVSRARNWRFAQREPVGGLDTTLGCFDMRLAVGFALPLLVSLSSSLSEVAPWHLPSAQRNPFLFDRESG